MHRVLNRGYLVAAMMIIRAAYFPTAASAVWVYTWPYGSNNACKCEDRSVGAYIDFSSAAECLESFALEDNEFCVYEGNGGVSLHDCENSVSFFNGVTDQECQTMCSNLVAGVTTYQEFSETCRFEFFTSFPVDAAVVPEPQGCFSNYVFGWSDYDPHSIIQSPPLKVLHDVDTPAQCQNLCQLTAGCVTFNWRGMADDFEVAASSFQNPPLTCILYDSEYMNGVLSTSVDPNFWFSGDSKFCNVDALKAECPPLSPTKFNPFEDDFCLLCGCMSKCSWKDKAHITGPAFCSATTVDVCEYHRPVWTSSTTPSPTCPTETCATGTPPAATTISPTMSTSHEELTTHATCAPLTTGATCVPVPPPDCCDPGDDCCDDDDEDCCDEEDDDCECDAC